MQGAAASFVWYGLPDGSYSMTDILNFPSGECNLETCFKEKCDDGGKLLVCQACELACYCCKDHQKSHWKQHKILCKLVNGKDKNRLAYEFQRLYGKVQARLAAGQNDSALKHSRRVVKHVKNLHKKMAPSREKQENAIHESIAKVLFWMKAHAFRTHACLIGRADTSKSLRYLSAARLAAKRVEDKVQESLVVMSIGMVYSILDEFDKVEQCLADLDDLGVDGVLQRVFDLRCELVMRDEERAVREGVTGDELNEIKQRTIAAQYAYIDAEQDNINPPCNPGYYMRMLVQSFVQAMLDKDHDRAARYGESVLRGKKKCQSKESFLGAVSQVWHKYTPEERSTWQRFCWCEEITCMASLCNLQVTHCFEQWDCQERYKRAGDSVSG